MMARAAEPCFRSRPTFLLAALAALAAICLQGGSLPAKAAQASCLQNTSQTSVIAAVQGDDDNNAIDIASQFLSGCDYGCQQTPDNAACDCSSVFHVPATWPCVQLHLDPAVGKYRQFYWDKTYEGPGKMRGMDESKPNGLELYPILFYVGHGWPEHFSAWPGLAKENEVDLATFSLGDVNVRYLLMLSCRVFAHGPRKDTVDQPGDFTAPEEFDPAKVLVGKAPEDPGPYMADVFYRWGKKYEDRTPLNRGLRLACGGSSSIGGVPYPGHRFWYYISVLGWRPADAFLAGLYTPEIGEVPLCISRGDSLQESGLDDSRFETKPLVDNPQKTPKFIFIEYPMKGRVGDFLVEKASKWAPVSQSEMPPQQPDPPPLPVLTHGSAPVPSLLHGVSLDGQALPYGFHSLSASAIRANLEQLAPADKGSPGFGPSLRTDDLCAKQHDSGSLVFSWRPSASGKLSPDVADKELDRVSNELLARLLRALPVPGSGGEGNKESRIVASETIPVQMRISTAPEKQNLSNQQLGAQKIDRVDGCFYILEKQAVRVAGVADPVPILGEGSETFVGRCPAGARRIGPSSLPVDSPTHACRRADPALASFVYNNRIFSGKRDAAQKSRQDAQKEAWARLEAMKQRDAYDLARVRWGYKAAPVHCKQDEMFLEYEFEFVPKRDVRYRDYAPLTIDVPAHSLPAPARRIEDTWQCSPEKPPG